MTITEVLQQSASSLRTASLTREAAFLDDVASRGAGVAEASVALTSLAQNLEQRRLHSAAEIVDETLNRVAQTFRAQPGAVDDRATLQKEWQTNPHRRDWGSNPIYEESKPGAIAAFAKLRQQALTDPNYGRNVAWARFSLALEKAPGAQEAYQKYIAAAQGKQPGAAQSAFQVLKPIIDKCIDDSIQSGNGGLFAHLINIGLNYGQATPICKDAEAYVRHKVPNFNYQLTPNVQTPASILDPKQPGAVQPTV